MLRILDARTGEPVPAAPARRGLTRIEAHASGLDPTALRVLLTADLLARALEIGGTPVWATLSAPRDQAELRTAATTLAIRPFEDGRDLTFGLGEAQAVHVLAEGDRVPGAGTLLTVAPVLVAEGPEGPARPERLQGPGRPERREGPESEEPGGLPPLASLRSSPTALRLALLSVPRSEPARLDAGALDEAGRRLARWRRAVAGWARHPSRPVPDEVRARLRAAWEDDLDLPGVLGVLRDVESAPDLPDGARFETYAHADRLLALDLLRDLGSLS